MFIFVTRHKGAIEWAHRHGIFGPDFGPKTLISKTVPYLTEYILSEIDSKDTVAGILPLHLAARVCATGARFLSLDIDVPPESRGKELTADEMERYGARLIEYKVKAVGSVCNKL